MMKHGFFRTLGLTSALLSAFAACGDRPDEYEAGFGNPANVGLDGRVAIVDDGAHRAVLLTPLPGGELDRRSIRVGRRVLATARSKDGKRLFVLSGGDFPRTKEHNEPPLLTIIDGGKPRAFVLPSVFSSIAVDPLGRWVAAYSGAPTASSADFIVNPNQFALIDLEAPAGTLGLTTRTLRSFGGRPLRLTFTNPLQVGSAARRLLVVESDQDVTLLDLEHIHDAVPRPEITVPLSSGLTARSIAPAGLIADDGDAARNDDARIVVRLAADSNVLLLTLAPKVVADPALNDFSPTVNLVDVGAPASAVAFVQTDAGRRLAALVPTRRNAALIDVETSTITDVALPDAYASLSLVTKEAATDPSGDVALLYGASGGVALWTLGKSGTEAYRSVDVLTISGGVTEALDVPAPHAELKVLRSANSLYVLNLKSRTASPLPTRGVASVSISSDGERLWAYQPSANDLAMIPFATLSPVSLRLETSVDAAHEVTANGVRSVLAIDSRSGVAATSLDGVNPTVEGSKSFFALLLEKLRGSEDLEMVK